MMKSIKRADKRKRDEIRKVRQYFIDAGIPADEVFFAQVKKVPDATAREHEWAIDYVALGNNPPNADWMKTFHNYKRLWNRSHVNEVIGVPIEFVDIHGNHKIMWFEQLAFGETAKVAAVGCDKPITGWQEKKKRLLKMSRDKKLKTDIENKMKDIERRARRK